MVTTVQRLRLLAGRRCIQALEKTPCRAWSSLLSHGRTGHHAIRPAESDMTMGKQADKASVILWALTYAKQPIRAGPNLKAADLKLLFVIVRMLSCPAPAMPLGKLPCRKISRLHQGIDNP